MAMRAPSFARRRAIPWPMPRVPPVINATRLRSNIPVLVSKLKFFKYSPAAQPALNTSTQARDDYRHVIGLLGRAGPFLGGLHHSFRDRAGRRTIQANCRVPQTLDAELLAIDIFRLHQTVAVANQDGIRRNDFRAFHKWKFFNHTEHHPAFVEIEGMVATGAKSRQVSGVRVAK